MFFMSESEETFYDGSSPTVMIYVMYKLLFYIKLRAVLVPLNSIHQKEPDDKPGYVVNDHLSNSAVASSF